jgi:hypothetical protein
MDKKLAGAVHYTFSSRLASIFVRAREKKRQKGHSYKITWRCRQILLHKAHEYVYNAGTSYGYTHAKDPCQVHLNPRGHIAAHRSDGEADYQTRRAEYGLQVPSR